MDIYSDILRFLSARVSTLQTSEKSFKIIIQCVLSSVLQAIHAQEKSTVCQFQALQFARYHTLGETL